MNKTYPIEKSGLYRLRNRKKLAQLLGLPPAFFRKEHIFEYKEFSRPKPNGDGKRHFTVPKYDLKQIQKRLCHLLMRIETPKWLISGKKHHSYITNAEKHLDGVCIKTMDISSFYDSAKKSYIFNMFRDKFLMDKDIAWLLTDLVTVNGKLPTGSPTSQIIVFWAYRDMFERIYDISQKYDCEFTLYVDDMTFSSKKPISGQLRTEVAEVLKKCDLKTKAKKDHYYQGKDFKEVTGVGIKNGKKVVVNRHRKSILDQYKKCREHNDKKEIQKLKGMLISARQVEPEIYPRIMDYIAGN